MAALTIGVTAAISAECKRGIAANIAASATRSTSPLTRVCVVDADPFERDVTTRFGVCDPKLHDFADFTRLKIGSLPVARHVTRLTVIPNPSGGIEDVRSALPLALSTLRDEFDLIICDLPCNPFGDSTSITQIFPLLDAIVVAATPSTARLKPATKLLDEFEHACEARDLVSPQTALVLTGDHDYTDLTMRDLDTIVDSHAPVRVPQLWGRRPPNVGFSAALRVNELDSAVTGLLQRFLAEQDERTVTEAQAPRRRQPSSAGRPTRAVNHRVWS